jgi:hypothetical protein
LKPEGEDLTIDTQPEVLNILYKCYALAILRAKECNNGCPQVEEQKRAKGTRNCSGSGKKGIEQVK